ncbi:MAG TPA: hypothetical protein VH764_17890 [Gemmatimonadales bacterium]
MRTMIRHAAALCVAAALAGCGDDDDGGFNPTMDEVAGSYSATTLTLDTGAGPTDLLAFGASVDVTLDADGSTSGRLFVPGGAPDGDLDEDLQGTWSLSGTTVTFTPSAATVLTDVDFAAGPNTLTGEGTYMGAVIRLVLTKDE